MTKTINKKKAAAVVIPLLLVLEGVSYVPYRDIGGVWTNGAGATGSDVTATSGRWTHAQVEARLSKDAARFMDGVLSCITREPTEGQLVAFTSLAFNVGLGKSGVADGFCQVKRGGPSAIVRAFNSGDDLGACLGILAWTNVGGKYSQGLQNRRIKEVRICLG